MRNKTLLPLAEIALFGVLGALTFGAKVAMSFLPNIEPVSLLIMVFAVVFGKKCLYPTYVYVTMEILLYGIGSWNIMYLYIWALLALGAYCLRKMESPVGWAVLSGVFGLLFGGFCMPVDIAIGGFGYAAAKWISGLVFDVYHCVGNFVIALLLFMPLRALMERLYRNLQRKN